MKKVLAILGAAVLGVSGITYAAVRGYYSATPVNLISVVGNSASNSFAIFPTDGNKQIRVTGVIGSADTNTALFSFYSGTTAATITVATNPAVATNVVIGSTIGFTTGASAWVLFEPVGAAPWAALCYSTNSGTNLVLYAAPRTALAVGDQVYVLGTPTTIPCVSGSFNGGTNVSYQGEALFVGNDKRPVVIRLNGSIYSNIGAASGKYD